MRKMKRLFSLALVATMGMVLVGCSNSAKEEEKTKETEIVEKEEMITLPTETMSPEETLKLTVGTEIKINDLDKMPDEAILEENNLMIGYIFEDCFYDYDGELLNTATTESGEISDNIKKNGYEEIDLTEHQQIRKTTLSGIKIYEFSFMQEDDGTWMKWATDSEWLIKAPVISEENVRW